MTRYLGLLVSLIGCGFDHGRFGSPNDATVGDVGNVGDADAPIDTPDGGGGPGVLAYVQGGVAIASGSKATVSVGYPSPQVAGNFNIVVVSYAASNETVSSVTDSRGNAYTAANPLISAGWVQQIYWASNIVGRSNTVTATTTANVATPKLRVFEYSGIATTSPVDDVAASSGVSNTPLAGPVNTGHAHDLIFAADVANNTIAAGAGFTARQFDDGDLVEDKFVTMKSAYLANAQTSSAGNWVMQVVAFKAAP